MLFCGAKAPHYRKAKAIRNTEKQSNTHYRKAKAIRTTEKQKQYALPSNTHTEKQYSYKSLLIPSLLMQSFAQAPEFLRTYCWAPPGLGPLALAEVGIGRDIIALSGFINFLSLGPSPSLISARESGTTLDCHPLDAW